MSDPDSHAVSSSGYIETGGRRAHRTRYRIHRDADDADEELSSNRALSPPTGRHAEAPPIRSGLHERRESTTSRESGLRAQPQRANSRTTPVEYVSRLSSQGRLFVEFARGDYDGCQHFINVHPRVLQEKSADYLADAQAALNSTRIGLAESCVQQALLIRDLKDFSTKERTKYFNDLIRQKTKPTKDFDDDFDAVMVRLRGRVPTPQTGVLQDSSLSAGTAAMQISNLPNRHSTRLVGGGGNIPPSQPRQHGSNTNPTRTSEPTNTRSRIYSGSNAPSLLSTGEVEVLDERYEVQASAFFVVGRVFAMLWHASVGHSQETGNFIRSGRFGERLISKIQRMAVVKEEHGFSWCLPISTYGGRGVAKYAKQKPISPANKVDIEAHAIIYMSETEPFTPDWEPSMSKEAIQVNPAGKDQQLTVMSRINFAKVHTVEHNVKVMSVGRVATDSRPYFVTYWEDKLRERPTVSGRR